MNPPSLVVSVRPVSALVGEELFDELDAPLVHGRALPSVVDGARCLRGSMDCRASDAARRSDEHRILGLTSEGSVLLKISLPVTPSRVANTSLRYHCNSTIVVAWRPSAAFRERMRSPSTRRRGY